ncbi:MAG: hypothetical protein AAGH89_16130 [Verrucomicrobiota bacterium]
MKTPIVVSAFAVLSAAVVFAIPDTIGGFFINPAGVRLEEFANRESTWEANGGLKGKWGMWNETDNDDTSLEIQRLEMRAVVFGVEAQQVTVHKRDNRNVRFEIRYSADSQNPGRITRQVLANIRAWSGKEISSQNPSMTTGHLEVRIGTLRDGGLQVFLEPRDS